MDSESLRPLSHTEAEKGFTPHPDYEKLPKAVKCVYTPKEYAWLDNGTRDNLVTDMTTPECFDDTGA